MLSCWASMGHELPWAAVADCHTAHVCSSGWRPAIDLRPYLLPGWKCVGQQAGPRPLHPLQGTTHIEAVSHQGSLARVPGWAAARPGTCSAFNVRDLNSLDRRAVMGTLTKRPTMTWRFGSTRRRTGTVARLRLHIHWTLSEHHVPVSEACKDQASDTCKSALCLSDIRAYSFDALALAGMLQYHHTPPRGYGHSRQGVTDTDPLWSPAAGGTSQRPVHRTNTAAQLS